MAIGTYNRIVNLSGYDTSVIITTALQAYEKVVATPEFFSGGNGTQHGEIYNTPGLRYEHRLGYLQNLTNNGQTWNQSLWTNLSALECAEYKVFESDRESLLLVTNADARQTDTQPPVLALGPLPRADQLGPLGVSKEPTGVTKDKNGKRPAHEASVRDLDELKKKQEEEDELIENAKMAYMKLLSRKKARKEYMSAAMRHKMLGDFEQ
ncbi:hypothetical protein BDV96DRAFT_654100 [Lophiotrema nucula]|uniref:Uncharacterized protein n=1 Tax=Lophiotrema nucula TaxID=690887 RepID=A0A6A5YKZ1_9PLEO|nr:hypothetical protein BDV96DRAFT_654100 [Lophiotrema nucula]